DRRVHSRDQLPVSARARQRGRGVGRFFYCRAAEPLVECRRNHTVHQGRGSMSSVLRSSAAVVLGAALFLTIGSARPAQALTACPAADITAQDPGCPASGACSITQSFTVGNSCVLDFTGRAVTVSASGVLDVGPVKATLNAGSLTVAPGGQIIGQEHCA